MSDDTDRRLERIENKMDAFINRLGEVEKWQAEAGGVFKAVKVAWTILAAAAAVAGWALAHIMGGVR